MIKERLLELGYTYQPADLKTLCFNSAVRVGNLIFTSGQIPALGEIIIKGKVGKDIDVETAKKAAEICAYKCLCAAGSVVDVELIKRAVKVTGMVNAAEGFNDTTGVINGCSEFLNKIFGEDNSHVRSAAGMTLPSDFAVEVEMIFSLE